MTELQIKSQVMDGVPIVRLVGGLDSGNASRVTMALDALVESDHPIVLIDMVDVDYIDSIGLGVLVAALKRTTDRDGVLSLIDPPSEVARVLRLTGLDKLFAVFGNAAEALVSVRRLLTR